MEYATFTIRLERSGDEQAVRGVHLAAFPSPVEADLVDELRAANRIDLSVVAVVDQIVVGHCALSPVAVRALDTFAAGLGLGPVAVLPAFQRRGIGAALIRRSIALCCDRDVGFVVVLGDPQYYRRFGFAAAENWSLRDEFNGGVAFQSMQLRSGAIPELGGRVLYATEFDKFKP